MLSLCGASQRAIAIAARMGFCSSPSTAKRAIASAVASHQQQDNLKTVTDESRLGVPLLISDNYNKLVRARDVSKVEVGLRRVVGSMQGQTYVS